MTTSAKVWIPIIVNTISMCHHDDWKNGIEKTCVYLHKTWDLTSLTMKVKESQIASCVTVHSLHENNKVGVSLSDLWPSHICIKKKPWAVGWWTPNLMHKAKEKMLEAILKNGTARWAQNQAPKHGHAQDFNRMWWQFENNSEMMMENECLWTLSKMISWKQSTPLSTNYSNGGMEVWIVASRWLWTHLRWTWNGSGPKLLTLIAPIKMGCKNFNAMIKATNPQIPQVQCWSDNLHRDKTYPTSENGKKGLSTN
jgi:hypothetical protein